jgi:hypothetical protein
LSAAPPHVEQHTHRGRSGLQGSMTDHGSAALLYLLLRAPGTKGLGEGPRQRHLQRATTFLWGGGPGLFGTDPLLLADPLLRPAGERRNDGGGAGGAQAIRQAVPRKGALVPLTDSLLLNGCCCWGVEAVNTQARAAMPCKHARPPGVAGRLPQARRGARVREGARQAAAGEAVYLR